LGSCYISTASASYKVDFEGYINFNDAGAEYKFTSSRMEWEYAAERLLVNYCRLEQILKNLAIGYYKQKKNYTVTAQVWGIV
jgi:hypothetical protein